MTTKDRRFFRCLDCGRLVNDTMIQKGMCLGHKVKEPAFPNLWERIKICLNLLG